MTTDETAYAAQPGDLFACWGNDWQSMAISLRTSSLRGPWELRWGPSHIAIACPRWYPYHTQPSWWESTSLCDRECLEACRRVSGVQVHHIADRLLDYLCDGGRVRVYRLTEIDRLTPDETRRLRDLLGLGLQDDDEDGSPYDMKGALVSGTRILRKFVAWKNQLDKVFCSELVAAVLQRLGRLCRENPSSFTPAQLLRRLLTEGTYQPCAELRLATDWTLKSTSLLPKDS